MNLPGRKPRYDLALDYLAHHFERNTLPPAPVAAGG